MREEEVVVPFAAGGARAVSAVRGMPPRRAPRSRPHRDRHGVGLPFVRIPYFRHGFIGVQAAGLRLFASKVYVREIVELGTDTTLITAISWV